MSDEIDDRAGKLAKEAADWFERDTRDDGESFVKCKDGAPDWVRDLVREAHGDFFPDDWRYAQISETLDMIAEMQEYGSDLDEPYIEPDIYTWDRLKWLGSHLGRADYCDEAMREVGVGSEPSIIEIIGFGQYEEKREVYESVLAFLRERALEDEGEDDGEEDA